MDLQKARLNEILADTLKEWDVDCQPETIAQMAEHLLENDVTVQKHGLWMPDSDDDQDEGRYYCSECKSAEFFPEGVPFSRYCSGCGAKMDKERES